MEERALLSELRSLEIGYGRGACAGMMLAQIAAPALRSLIMRNVLVSETGAHDFEDGDSTDEALIFEELEFLVCCVAYLSVYSYVILLD